jgi:phosphoesterase RecJ-like protein
MSHDYGPDWKPALDAIRGAHSIALACHENPDGDALGSLLGASLGLRKVGKRTWPTWAAAEVRLPVVYDFLPGGDSLVAPAQVASVDAFIALDCGAADRLGALEEVARAAPVLVNIDHHTANENFGTLNVVVSDASSTAEIVYALLRELDVELDGDIATCLYTGIVTDTGRFQYENSSPDTLRLAADLIEIGVVVPEIAQAVFESSPWGYLKLLGRVLERAVLCEPERFVYSVITDLDLEATGLSIEQTEKVIDQVRATSAADVAALFKQQPDGTYRVSLRSKGGRSVGALARARGGGGHELAAGFTAPDVESTVAALRAELRGEMRAGWTDS